MSDPAQTNELMLRAECLLQHRELAEAWSLFHAAEEAGADVDRCAGGRWTAAMLRGDFEGAWHESDSIRLRDSADPHRFWLGQAIDGKHVIVRCLHGLGDSVQMLRYLPLLQARCRSVVVEVPPRLLPLAGCFAGADLIITWGDLAPDQPPGWEVQIEVMELPYIFRTSKCELPLAERYLVPPVEAVVGAAHRMGSSDRPRVGIVWSASEWDGTRRLPLASVKWLLATPGIEFWNLQGGAQHEEGKQSAAIASIADAAAIGDGLVPLAAVIANLDLVLTVDTLAAHLAGAMGKPAWVLLQAEADWRWMHGCDNSPWYPSLRLWRQSAQGDWSTLMARVVDALQVWATTWRVHAA